MCLIPFSHGAVIALTMVIWTRYAAAVNAGVLIRCCQSHVPVVSVC
jgi:hypothetical protein